MVQASSGGLEKYPQARSRDQLQYCASSGNRSTTEVVSPARRTRVSSARIATARPRRDFGNETACWATVMSKVGPERRGCAGNLHFPQPSSQAKRDTSRILG